MKLVYPDWEKQLVWKDGRFPLVVLENPEYYFRTAEALYLASKGADSRFVLSDGEHLLEPARFLVTVPSPWSMEWDSRRLMTAFYGRIRKAWNRPELLEASREAQAAAARCAEAAAELFSFPLTYEAESDPLVPLKAVRLRPEPEEGPLAERMLSYMDLCTELLGTACFCFCGFRHFLAREALEELYRTAFLKQFCFFLLESSAGYILKEEDGLIVDQDLCQIF